MNDGLTEQMRNKRHKSKGDRCLLCGCSTYEFRPRGGKCPVCGFMLTVNRSERTVAILPGNTREHVQHKRELSELLQICNCLILDLSGYDVLDSPAMESLALLSSLKDPRRRLIVIAGTEAQQEFRITRVDRVFDIFDSLHDALTE